MRFSQPPKKNGLSDHEAMKVLNCCREITFRIHRISETPTMTFEMHGLVDLENEQLIGNLFEFAMRPIEQNEEDEEQLWN